MERLKESMARLSRQLSELCIHETPELDGMLGTLKEIERQSSKLNASTLHKVAEAFKSYVERMLNSDVTDTTPLEHGITLMQALIRHLEKETDFIFDISDVLQILDTSFFEQEKQSEALQPSPEDLIPPIDSEDEPEQEKFDEEELQILSDFVIEAEENLASIEIELVELEHDPENQNIINNIFRPFHTIKGVSGFLNLKKINKLSHSTENLLDCARNGEFIINDIATDAILESVDMLKYLISRLSEAITQKTGIRDNDIDIETLRQKLETLPALMSPARKEPVGEILVRQGIIDNASLDSALNEQNRIPGKKLGEILVDTNKAKQNDIDYALREQKKSSRLVPKQVKVDTAKLDDLVDYTGELVIAQSMLKQRALKDSSLHQHLSQLEQIVSKIQNIAMSMRMIPIKSTFMKMIRLVRDLARKSNKNVALNMSGEETEIDRNVVDALYEPMVHMIRNSIDHGIESIEERQSAGKPEQGNIFLRAYHKGGNMVIEIEDDGRGLDKQRILEKARSAGIVSSEATLADSQIFDLIMQPGFSTAQKITDISGRGVGMDVVKDGIEKFRGHLGITSNAGTGTRFTISLPLTLAIIDGMLIRVGTEKYVIPTIAIQRSFRPMKADCFTVKGKGEMIRERNGMLPLIRLENICGVKNDAKEIWESLVVIIESKDEIRGLLIDELLGKDEYVIKSLGGNLEDIIGFSGGAILGDGRVGLILDAHGIFQLASRI